MEFNGTFLATIISFLIFVFLMNKVLYEPMRKIVTERQSFVDDNLQIAEENNRQAKVILKQRDDRLQVARVDAKGKYFQSVEKFKSQKNTIVENAQQETLEELSKANENLKNVSNNAKEGLKNSMTDLANDIVEKMIGYRSEVQDFDQETVNKILYQ